MQWLVFRNDGATTAGQWAQDAAQYGSKASFLAVFDRGKEQGQQAFVKEILRQTMKVRSSAAHDTVNWRQSYHSRPCPPDRPITSKCTAGILPWAGAT